jgi:hypothetical protein
MCIIVGAVRSVTGTQIFVAPSVGAANGGDRQLVVYSNSVDTPAENLMILPLPHPETLKFEKDVMDYAGLFKDLKASLYKEMTLSVMRSAPPSKTLDVFDVGSYRVSVAMSFQDLYNLNKQIFPFSEDLYKMLQSTYPPRIGFLCCALKPGETQYKPLAYSHRRDEATKLFVPTKHYHLGEDTQATADWDHEIYSVGTVVSAHRSQEELYVPRNENQVMWNKLPAEYQWGTNAKIHRWACKGEYPNIDVGFAIA